MKRFLTLLLPVIFLALSAKTSKASHTAGMDLIYRHISGNQFELIFRFYRDCQGISAPSSVTICANSSTCGISTTYTLPQTSLTSASIPLPCMVNPGSDPCTNPSGTAFGFQEAIYKKVVTLPQKCVDWVFSYSLCCRPAAVDNINPTNQYIEAKLNNVDAPENSSPHFHDITAFPPSNPYYVQNYPIRSVCPLKEYNFVQDTREMDGDSVVYSLYHVQGGSCTNPSNIAYNAPYTPQFPLPYVSTFGFNFDSQKGVISFKPQKIPGEETYVVGIKAEEYRNDTIYDSMGNIVGINPIKIGEIKRDMTIIVNDTMNCVDDNLALIGGDATGPNGAVDSATGLPVYYANCATDHMNLYLQNAVQCFTIEPNGTDFALLDTNTNQQPLNPPNTIASAAPLGNCAGGSTDSLRLNFYHPLSAGVYYVVIRLGMDQNTLISECGIQAPPLRDTLLVVVDSVAAVNLTASAYSVCIPTDSMPVLNSGINSSQATYVWTYYNDTLNSTGPTHTADTTGKYSVYVELGTACSGSDTLEITINRDPVLNLDSVMYVCTDALGSTVFDAGVDSASYEWYFDNGTGSPLLIGNDKTQSAIDAGYYYLNVTKNGCSSSDTLELIITPNLQVDLNQDQFRVCEDTEGVELNTGMDKNEFEFEWFRNGAPIANSDNPKITVLESGEFVVKVTDEDNGCYGYDTAHIVMDTILSPPQVNCDIESDDEVNFYWESVSGASGYEISEDGGETWIAPNGDNGLTHTTSSSIQSILIRSYNDSSTCGYSEAAASLECSSEITLPNVITPNGDGTNDKLIIDFLDLYPGSHLTIFDRWGRKIYDQEYTGNEDTAWDGDGHSAGTYYVILKVSDGRTFNKTLTLIK